MSSLANGCCINQNSDDISETEEFFVNHAYGKSSHDRNNRKSYNDNSGKICSKYVLDEDFCIEQSSELVGDLSILSSDSRTINKPNRSCHTFIQVVDGDNRFDQVRSYITLLLVNIFFSLDFEKIKNMRNGYISHIIIIAKKLGIVGLCFLSTNSIDLSWEKNISLESSHLNESSQDNFTSSSSSKINEKEYHISKKIFSVPTCIEKCFKFFFSRKAILFFVYVLFWIHFCNFVEEAISTNNYNIGNSTGTDTGTDTITLTSPRKRNDDKQIVYLDPEVFDNDTGIVLVNKTVDVPFQVQQESRNLHLPKYMFQQSTNVGKKGALISTKESDSSMALISLDATKHCTQPTVSHRTEDAVVTLSSERHMINFISLKELLILREQCVKRKVQVNGHTQNDVYVMMELYQYGRGRQFGSERTKHEERSGEMIKIDTSFQKEGTHEGAISNIPRSPIGLIASVSLRKQKMTLEIIRGITRNGSRARRQMVKVFHKQLHTWTETEIASTLYIVWTNAGILD